MFGSSYINSVIMGMFVRCRVVYFDLCSIIWCFCIILILIYEVVYDKSVVDKMVGKVNKECFEELG